MSIDWKKVASDRLRMINRFKSDIKFIAKKMEDIIRHELEFQFHARCLADSAFHEKLVEIAHDISERLYKEMGGKQ